MIESVGESHIRLLLVEDNDLNRDMILRRLVRRGFEVTVALSGRQAIDIARSDTPDLILIDLRLPDMSGLEAARMLKSEPRTQSIPLVALTAEAMEGDRARALAAGCDEYQTKPIDLPSLLEKIRLLLARRTPLSPQHPFGPQAPPH